MPKDQHLAGCPRADTWTEEECSAECRVWRAGRTKVVKLKLNDRVSLGEFEALGPLRVTKLVIADDRREYEVVKRLPLALPEGATLTISVGAVGCACCGNGPGAPTHLCETCASSAGFSVEVD